MRGKEKEPEFQTHLPPNLHVLLASRADPALPLARLRARGQVVEIREADLRLWGDEIVQFLRQVMGPVYERHILKKGAHFLPVF